MRTTPLPNPSSTTDVLCRVDGLRITFPRKDAPDLVAVRDLDLEIRAGEVLGLVGESGSGKSLSAMAVLGFLPAYAQVDGEIHVAGRSVLTLSPRQRAELCSQELGLIMQDPAASLNPLRTVRSQMLEAAKLAGVPSPQRKQVVDDALADVELDAPALLQKRPFELSGGMNQRLALAMALVQSPSLLVADEPTTALDVTTQARILQLLRDACKKRGMALLLISHDLGVIYHLADRIAVLYAGELAEVGPREAVALQPRHPYTRGLISAIPPLEADPTLRLHGIPGQLRRRTTDDQDCAFAARCQSATDICREVRPDLEAAGPGESQVACHHHAGLPRWQEHP